MARYEGTVHWFNNAKGYAFLGRDDGPDVFVHFGAVEPQTANMLEEGKLVDHDLAQDKRGQRENPALPLDSKS